MQIIRDMKGLNIVGTNMVEVSPPYDQAGTTPLTAASPAFEILCVMPGTQYR